MEVAHVTLKSLPSGTSERAAPDVTHGEWTVRSRAG